MDDSANRQRLTVDARRAQLLEVGCELFANSPYDEVWIDHVAARAGVSRGLIYHYFGNKRGFLHAVVEHETAAILAATAPNPELPLQDQLASALDAYLSYARTHPHGYRALFRGAASTDSAVRAMIDANLRQQRTRILDALVGQRPPSRPLQLAVPGWLALTITVTLDWLDSPDLDVSQVRTLCVDALAAIAFAVQGATEEPSA